MKAYSVAFVACLVALSSSFAQKKGETGTDERVMQTFAVLSGEQKTATDFVLRVRWLQGVDILTSVTDGMKVTRMDVIYEGDQLKFFKLARENKDEFTVRARRDSFVITHVAKGTSTLPRRGGEIVLEPNAFGHYAFLLYRYDAVKGGKQTYRAFVPTRQAFIPVVIERHGGNRFQCGEAVIEASHYQVLVDNKDLVHVWSVRDGKVVGIHLPSKGICVVDEEYENLHNNIRALALEGF